MTDTMTPEQRHRCMSHIRSKATKPELKVRRWLWSHGYRYRLNVKSVPGKPDIVLRPYRTAIFVNGCFWHGHGVRMRERGNALMCESAEPRSGNNLRDLQDFARVELEQEYKERDIQNSKCCKIPTTNREFWVAKIRPQPGARPRELPRAAGERLAGHRRLGVPAEAQPDRTHHARGGAAAEQQPAIDVQAPPRPLPYRG